MLGLRPKSSALFLERPRLLGLLPEEAGYVVWLEAPYGYGKSVLTSQWASHLEGQGWRVVWVATLGEDPRPLLAKELELPGATPWSIVLEALSARPTLIILEDLEGHEPLSPLLKNPAGLVLLASRQPLPQPELPRLMTEGRLIHLKAATLAFTLEEALQLFDDAHKARTAWNETSGWSLPLHLAALTGEIPEREALLEGMRESLSQQTWDEALLLAVLPYLPGEAATASTKALAEAGFAQGLQTGYRIHPLMAETLLRHHLEEVRPVVEREAHRLPPLLQGQALECCGLKDGLAMLLETQQDLDRQDPQAVVRWDSLAPLPRGWLRLQQAGASLCIQRRTKEGMELLRQAASLTGATAEQALLAYKEMVWYLAVENPEEARAVVAQAEPLLNQVDPELAGRFLSDTSRIDFMAGNLQQAQTTVERALGYMPRTSSRRFALLMNLSILHWNRSGDIEGRLAIAGQALAQAAQHFPEHVPGVHLDLGRLELLLNRTDTALQHFQLAARGSKARPWINLESQALTALLQDGWGQLPALLARIQAWEQTEVEDRVRALWAWRLVEKGQAKVALDLLGNGSGFMAKISRALALGVLGSTEEALSALPDVSEAPEREPLLHWYAACYRITGAVADLEALLDLTQVRVQILPALVPLSKLPKSRPELVKHYPLKEVLGSGWKEAVIERFEEIPELHIQALGQFGVWCMGQEVELAPRPKAILLHLLLRRRREEIAEVLWSEVEVEKSRNNLHVNLNFLRKAIEPWGVQTYLSESGLLRTQADLWELERALGRGDAESVLRLYQGPLAPEESSPIVDDARAELQEQVIEVLFQAAQHTADAEVYLGRILQLDPINETALRQLLQLLIRKGRRQTAHRLYQEFAQRLHKEMGLEPAPETWELLA